MATVFSETLVRLRKEAGYPTAYRFFHDNGGAQLFKVSYRNYLMMEQGRNLPVLGRLQKILVGLHMALATPAARELTRAWLRTMAGEEAYADLMEPLLEQGVQESRLNPAEEALRRTLVDRKHHITMDQILATVTCFESFKCYFIVENDSGAWTAEAMAKAAGIKRAAAERALKDFLKAGLVKAEGKGAYRSKLAGLMVEYPDGPAIPRKVLEKIKAYQARLVAEGRVEFGFSGTLRADSDALRSYFPMLRSSVEASHAFSTVKKTRKSAGFFVSAQVHKLFDF